MEQKPHSERSQSKLLNPLAWRGNYLYSDFVKTHPTPVEGLGHFLARNMEITMSDTNIDHLYSDFLKNFAKISLEK